MKMETKIENMELKIEQKDLIINELEKEIHNERNKYQPHVTRSEILEELIPIMQYFLYMGYMSKEKKKHVQLLLKIAGRL